MRNKNPSTYVISSKFGQWKGLQPELMGKAEVIDTAMKIHNEVVDDSLHSATILLPFHTGE